MDGKKEIQKAYESILGNDFEQAIDWFEQAVAQEPDNASYHYKLSVTYARSNKLAKALKHANAACRLEPQEEHYLSHLHILQARELVHKAEKCFRRSKKQLYLAIAMLKQAVLLDPLSLEAFLLLALANAELEQYAEAIRYMKEVLKLDPQHEAANRLVQEYGHQLQQYTGSPITPRRE